MEAHRTVIIGNANLFTMGGSNRQIEKGGIYAEDGIIKKIDKSAKLQEEYPRARFIDMKNMLVLPGNVMTHTHLYSTFARGMGLKDAPPANFVEILERLWWRLDKALTMEDVYYSALVYLAGCIRCGTTTIIDHHASPGAIDGSLDTIARAVLEAGIRASLCYEITDRGGREEALAGIRENVRFLEKWKDNPHSLLRGAMGFHASFTVSDETFRAALEAAIPLDPVLHIHVEEDLSDRKDSEEKSGMPVLTRLHNLGATRFPILACHCVHLAASEYEILKNNNIYVIHNPSSNMNNAVGVAPVMEMMDNGITVGLGTDGMTPDFFSEMKILPLPHKIKSGDPRTFPFDRLYQMIFLNNPKIADLFWKENGPGYLEEGRFADVIGLDYDPPTPLNAGNILGHILFGITSGMVNTTIVNGQELMRDRRLLHLDEKRIMAKSRELAAQMWTRF